MFEYLSSFSEIDIENLRGNYILSLLIIAPVLYGASQFLEIFKENKFLKSLKKFLLISGVFSGLLFFPLWFISAFWQTFSESKYNIFNTITDSVIILPIFIFTIIAIVLSIQGKKLFKTLIFYNLMRNNIFVFTTLWLTYLTYLDTRKFPNSYEVIYIPLFIYTIVFVLFLVVGINLFKTPYFIKSMIITFTTFAIIAITHFIFIANK